ncbi:MAG: hypothetical protein M1830_008871 [Pleopsidium flavum]|nr:MAG: hypothetical protein M1830_008871 [Pleopsidium flavum]
MSAPGSKTEFMGSIAYELSRLQPFLPTYLHLLVAALFPIYTGAHASLSRPPSAAKPPKREKGNQDNDEDEVTEEAGQRMEGLSPTDAIMFPLLAGTTLAGLYFLLKWLQDPALLNAILNWYFSAFGVLSVARILTDSMGVLTSFLFPARYIDNGIVWHVNSKRRTAERVERNGKFKADARSSPLPGTMGRISLPMPVSEALWSLRALPNRKLRVQAYVQSMMEADFRIGIQGFTGLGLAVVAVAYFNVIAKPWWLTNLLGFGFSYSALQFMSPTTFWTGTLILSSLFFYDIYFVFFTPLMVTVATKLDIPIKLLFPRPPGPDADPAKQSLSMLGLGDVVLPGIMIGLALRFDLYLFYLRKQTKGASTSSPASDVEAPKEKLSTLNNSSATVSKPQWHSATGCWGERFWTSWIHVSPATHHTDGGIFPKTYFHASLIGYVIGMLVTLAVMQIASHAQPALLYLVPGVLGSLWGTALVRGELKEMWEYTEATEEEDPQGKQQIKGMESIFSLTRAEKTAKKLERNLLEERPAEDGELEESKTFETTKEDPKLTKNSYTRDKKRDIVFFSISLPPAAGSTMTTDGSPTPAKPPSASMEDELRSTSGGNLASGSTITSSLTSRSSSPRRRATAEKNEEPVEKRQRRE